MHDVCIAMTAIPVVSAAVVCCELWSRKLRFAIVNAIKAEKTVAFVEMMKKIQNDCVANVETVRAHIIAWCESKCPSSSPMFECLPCVPSTREGCAAQAQRPAEALDGDAKSQR